MDALSVSRLGATLLVLLSAGVLIALLILRGRGGPRPAVRRLPAYRSLQDEIGYTAESGGAIHVALGSGGLHEADAAASLGALQVVEAIADAAVSYSVPPIITVGEPTLLPLAQDVLRRAYVRHGVAELYDPSRVRFIAPSPLAYAAGAAHVVATEGVTANVVAGSFGAEASLITDAGTRSDVRQLAAVDAPLSLGALYPATDYLAAGEELYAAGAQLTGDRRYLVSLVAQDVLRVILVLIILGASFVALLRGIL